LITDLLAGFVDIADDVVADAIAGALARLGRSLDVDRITLSEADNETFRVLHSWAAPGAAPVPQTFKVLQMPWYVRQLRRGQTLAVSRAADLPPEAAHEREMMRRMGTRSHLAIPLSIGHGVVGALSLGALRRQHEWPDHLVRRLRLVGQIFATALWRKKSNERMARQEQELAHIARVAAVGELVSILAHDLNQPLAAILTNAQATRRLIERCGAGPRETDEALADIADDATRAGEIIRRLRALLRKSDPSLGAVDLNRLLADSDTIVAAEVREHEVALRFELAAGLPPVRADAVQLQQVLLNLVSNACHAMSAVPREQRELVIRTARGSGQGNDGQDLVRFEICDSGPPIAPDVFRRFFEPFFTTKPTGLGMGLAITRSIVAAHRGRVWATQNARRGITVHVALPVCP
jgi:C4-dicarboxylate-specific signal transduction histidine kinase